MTEPLHIGHARLLLFAGVARRHQKALSDTAAQAEWEAVAAAREAAEKPVREAAEAIYRRMGRALAQSVRAKAEISERLAFDVAEWIEAVRAALGPAVAFAIAEGFRTGALRVALLDSTFNPESPAVLRILSESLNAAQSIPETARGFADTILRDGIERGQSVDEIARRIGERIEELTPAQARTIAQTTGGAAFEAGQMEAYTEAGAESHTWLSRRIGENRREDHIALDGETVALGAEFSNGLKFPRDPSGPASEVVNCDCTTLPSLPEAEKAAPVPAGPQAERDAWIRAEYGPRMKARGMRVALAEMEEEIAERSGAAGWAPIGGSRIRDIAKGY